jgi:hypothetical protein
MSPADCADGVAGGDGRERTMPYAPYLPAALLLIPLGTLAFAIGMTIHDFLSDRRRKLSRKRA